MNQQQSPLSNTLQQDKIRASSSNIASSTLKRSPTSTSLLSRTRKISAELKLSRPLKRATSLSYRVFTPTEMEIPPTSVIRKGPDINASPQLTSKPTYGRRLKKRFRSLRRISVTPENSNFYNLPISASSSSNSVDSNIPSPYENFTCENFAVNRPNLASPPSSPRRYVEGASEGGLQYNDEDDEEERCDTSCFSTNSGNFTRDTSYNLSSFNNSTSCESSPVSKKSLVFKPILTDIFKPNPLFTTEIVADGQDDVDMEADIDCNYGDLLTLKKFHTSSICSNHKLIPNRKQPVSPIIFQIPEILELILRNVAYDDIKSIPTEPKMHRRPPLSYNHSLLMYGEKDGRKVWDRTVSNMSIPSLANGTPYNSTSKINNLSVLGNNGRKNANLYNCLFVNKQWHYTMISIINENLHFQTEGQFENFTSKCITASETNLSDTPEPQSLIIHKVKTTQSIVDIFASQVSPRRLQWLEFYICPNILPPISFSTPSLKKLVLPGCKLLNDDHLKLLVSKAPGLKHLDIRACDQITDSSLYYIAHNCPELELLNCGRHRRGELITDISIGLIAKKCPIKTIGLAGCGISDWSVWELALHCGGNLERVSLNYCWKLTDVGVCKAAKTGLLDNVSVLEIRGVQLTDVKELVNWKRRKLGSGRKVLIEACEKIDTMIKNYEEQVQREMNSRMLQDIERWANGEDGGDTEDDVDRIRYSRGSHM